MSFPTSPPPGLAPRPWAFPTTRLVTLPSGATVAAVRVPTLPAVHVRWVFRSGRVQEPDAMVGAARLVSATARHGTARWSSEGLAEHLDSLGARLGVAIGVDNAVFSATALREHLPHALDLIEEVGFGATFPDSHVARERAQLAELHKHDRAQPSSLAGAWLAHLLYPGHPYGRPGIAIATLGDVDVAAMRAFRAGMVDPCRGLLLAVGDIDPDALMPELVARADRAQALHAQLASHGVARTTVGPAPVDAPPRVLVADRPGSEQISISVGHTTFPRSHPDYVALRLVNQVLGGGASSRLFMELRERRSLTYGAYSALDTGLLGGDLTVSVATAPDKAAEAVVALKAEVDRVADGDVGTDELEHARHYLAGSFPQRASGVRGVAALVTRRWLHALPDDAWEQWPVQLAELDRERVVEAARRWIRPDGLCAVAVGPADVAASAIAPLGPVEVRPPGDLGFEPGAGHGLAGAASTSP